jgi:hypothetical protein
MHTAGRRGCPAASWAKAIVCRSKVGLDPDDRFVAMERSSAVGPSAIAS